MKLKIMFLCLAFISYSCVSQKKNDYKSDASYEPIGKVSYIYKSKERKYLISRESFLLFNEKKSIFIHSRGKDPMVEVMGNEGQDGYVQDKIGNLILKDFENDVLKIRELVIFQPYITQEVLPKFKWEITNKKRKIGRFKCTLAKTTFRGRNYNAWFTSEIPISDGPWKFNGLPGLILEVIDAKNEYQFIYKAIEIPVVKEEKIVFINKGKSLPFEEFIKADDIEFNKLRKQTQASWNGEGELKVTKPETNPIEFFK